MIRYWPHPDYHGRFRARYAQPVEDNPVLRDGEMAIDADAGEIKQGDGATAWNALPPLSSGGGGGTPTTIDGGTP